MAGPVRRKAGADFCPGGMPPAAWGGVVGSTCRGGSERGGIGVIQNNNGNGIGRCGEYLQYDFTKEELEEFSKELARHTIERSRLEQQKKEVDSQLKSQIEAENTQIAVLASDISTGHVSRMIDCAIFWHNPKNGRATICRIDTGEVVRERGMTYEE